MKVKLNLKNVNQITKGDVIYEAGETLNSICLVVKGRVRVEKKGARAIVGSGSFLGICDIFSGQYTTKCTAEDNVVLFAFPAEGSIKDLQFILQTKNEYGALAVSYLNKYITDIAKNYIKLKNEAEELPSYLLEQYSTYQKVGKAAGAHVDNLKALNGIAPLESQLPEPDADRIAYCKACTTVRSEVQKEFFKNVTIATFQIKEQIALVNDILAKSEEYADYIYGLTGGLIRDNNSIYTAAAKLATSLKRIGEDNSEIMTMIDNLVDCINRVEELLINDASIESFVDREFMEDVYFSLLSGGDKKDSAGSVENMGDELFLSDMGIGSSLDISVLDGSLDQILDYTEIEEETAEQFRELVEEFSGLKDKTITDDASRNLRRNITKLFYEIYHKVFLKEYAAEGQTPHAIRLFLNYGFVSEKLMTEEHLEELLLLDCETGMKTPCEVFTMREWLTQIYEGKKEPSKSEFDMDYTEYLRDMKKNGQITAEEEARRTEDVEAKLEYEIKNIFSYNHRLLASQISAFVPILCSDLCSGSLDRNFLSKDKVNSAIRRLIQIDYSLFYRESLYVNEEEGIKKEFIMEEVFPDIILFPVYGDKGIMWQEISGRKRNSKGRFLFPQFLETNLDAALIKLAGRFRWELCRTIQGASWNNIQYKSLTSEYSDFIQFYRKNRELSDEKKEKLKTQIQKGRNNNREVFTIDYEGWIKNESHGGICLNKPAREILATYCPFAASIREEIGEQPIFRDAMARYYREKAKKTRELDLRYRVLEKEGVELPQVLLDTKKFYQEM